MRLNRKMKKSKEHIVIPFKKNGMPTVTLEKEGKRSNHSVAFLVAQAFVPNPNNLPFVKHKDGNLENCEATNLYWSETE